MSGTVDNSPPAGELELACAAFDAAPDAVVVVNDDAMVLLSNRRADELFGYEQLGLRGLPLSMLLPEDVREHHEAYLARYFTAPRARPMGTGLRIRGRRSDGTEFSAEVALSPLTSPDGDLVVATSIHDVTEQVRAMEERVACLRDREALAESHIAEATRRVTQANFDSAEYHRALEHYNQLIRHRVANPLHVIRGMAQTLRAMPELNADTRKQMLDAIDDAAASLGRATIFDPQVQSPAENGLQPRPGRRA